uniref:Dyneins heavy chain n=2 Tax=Lutzomyia longipalpis TaxID=7200 RepID=A0A1B0CUL2_LUTLO
MSKYLSKLIKPPRDYEKYENDAFSQHPLMKFRLSNIRERRHFSMLKHRAALGKIRVCRTIPEDLSDVLPQRQDKIRQQLYMYANSAPIPKILHRTEKKIIEYVPERLRKRYPNAVEDYMKEVREDYDKIIRAFSIQKILVPKEGEFVPPREEFRLKAKGRTRNYRQFLHNRKQISKNLLITAPYIRCIVHFANLDFPDVLNDLSRYRKLGEIILDELENKARKDLYTNAEFLKKFWYPKIVRVMLKYYKKKVISRMELPRILQCATTLINRQITELKIRTLNHICEVIGDREKIPYLKVSLICEKSIDLYPTLEKIFKVYHDMLDDVAEIGTNLTSLEILVDSEFFKNHDEYLKISVGEIYMKEAHEKLNKVLEKAYSPVILYLSSFQDEYKFLSNPETRISIESFLEVIHTFDEYLSKIETIQIFIDRLRRCILREFFDFMTLNQFEAIQSLREIADNLVDKITDHIVTSHRKMCDDICATFVEIKRKALEIPKSTESLLESAEYMVYVKTQQMKELQDRIEECLKIGGTLLEFKELSKDHLAAQIATINWYNNIDDVFEQNAQLQEFYKFQFEEHLQNVAKKLNEDIAEMLPSLSIIDDMCETEKFREYYGLLQNIIDNLKIFENYVDWLNKEEKLFKFPKSTYPVLDAIKNFVIPFTKLMKLCIEWLRHFYVWMDGPFEYLEPDFVARTVEEYLKEFQETQKYYHNRIKADLIGNPICKFRGQTEDPSVEKHPVPLKLCHKMISWIQEFGLGVQIVKIICNPALRERHWNEMSQMVGFDLTPDAGTTLRKFIDYKLEDKLGDFEIISIGANKELQLQQNLTGMIEEWSGVCFKIGSFKNTSLTILTGVEDIQGLLGDHINKTLAMRGSAFVKPCEVEVKAWYSKLVRVNSTIEQWLRVQMLWLYFLPIFSAPDIVAQIESEGDLFREVDGIFHKYMKIILDEAEVMKTAPIEGFLEDLQDANKKLDTITWGVNGYLDRKRLFFSRFFFLSNDEMLEILSETKDPVKVESHLLKKCFEGIDRLSFDDELNIREIRSDLGERIELLRQISTQNARGSVEKWLWEVEREMIKAVKDQIQEAFKDISQTNRSEWIFKWPQMVVLCCQKIFWTFDIEGCFRADNPVQMIRNKLKEHEEVLTKNVDLIRSSDLTPLQWIVLKSLIVLDVHSRDVYRELQEKSLCLKFLERHCKQFLQPGEMNLIMSTLNLFEMFMNEACEDSSEEFTKNLSTWFQAATVMAIFWGLAGILDATSRSKFDAFFREIWRNDEDSPLPESVGRIEVTLPTEGLLVEYCYHFKQKGMWKYWPDIVRRMEPETTPLGMQVPTIDTARYSYLFELLIKNKKPFLLTGPTGTGKSFFIQNFLMSKVAPETFTPSFVTFTVMISAGHTQELILSKLVKKRRWQYGAARGKTAIIFVDDMNMPAKDEYEAQPPLELLRQYFDHSFWHTGPDRITLRDILLICACGPPGGSRQVVYQRVLRHFNIFSINNFSEESLSRIFSAILLNGLKTRGHASDVVASVNSMVAATLHIYRIASTILRPTPQKSHYIFNLRDISRVISGCSLLRKESVDNKKMFPKIWLHETMRTFCDRLTDSRDRYWFFGKISTTAEEHFSEKLSTIFEEYRQEGSEDLVLNDLRNFMFASYLDLNTPLEERKYEEIPDLNSLKDLALASLEQYNSKHTAKLDIVLFGYALEHLNKICRVLTVPAGSCLLVGIGGSGRQSLTRVAAGICQQNVFQPHITREYGLEDWRRDLKIVLREAGGLGKDTVFLFTDSQVNLEVFLQDIDCLLNLGEVPNIYGIDERQEILEMVRLDAQGGNRNIDISPLQVFSFFVNRCRQRLHIVLCFSPIGDSLRTRVRLYPSLVNCCTIDWYEDWPPEALEMVAVRYMQAIDIPAAIKESAVVACKHFHLTATKFSGEFFRETSRIIHITSACYIELIRSFRDLMEKKQKEILESTKRYEAGLETLVQASNTVAIMQCDLNDLQPKLIIMAENSREMMKQIEKKTIEASEASEHVKKEEVSANAQAAVAQELKDECEKDLAQAIPILEEAIQALNTLKPADITLVKSMKNPPEVVKLVMAAVCVIKGVPPDRINDPATGKKIIDYWGPSKRILGDMGFLQSLKDFDKDNIGVDIMKKIRKDFIPHKDFQPHIVLKASSAAEGLCKWIIAMDLYDSVAKIVAPKKTRLEVAEKEYADTLKILNEKRQMADELERKVQLLNEQLTEANREMQRVEMEVDVCKNKLQRAESLIASLGGEKNRWTLASENLQKLYNNLAGDILMSCGFIAYLAPFSIAYRKRALCEWHALCLTLSIPCSVPFKFTEVLGSDIKLQNWSIAGLPKDSFSAENATIMDNSSRYSLFIDPQSQANSWIKTLEKPNGLRVVKFSQSNYMTVLADCIQLGTPCLIESIKNHLEVQLNPILFKHTFFRDEQEFIDLGSYVIEFNSNFRLYLTSNSRNPHYLPEVVNKVTIINFSLTLQGLEDQLLGIVVAKERPDLQELRQKMILESAENQKVLKEVEDSILKTLSTSKGDILEDERAIKILDDSKKTEREIEAFRFSYRAVASHSSVLYYCITDLPNIDPMYQFSLGWYINLYIFSIENANKSKDIFRRLKFLMDTITHNLYTNVCRSIFEKDKPLFSFILTTKIMIMCNQINQEQYNFLLKGGKPIKDSLENPAPSWIGDKLWLHLQQLEQMEEFRGFIEDFKVNIDEWKEYYDTTDPQTAPFPRSWDGKINRFEKLLVLNTIRPDKTAVAIQEFIACEMGPLYVRPPAFDITKSFEEANCLMPLIFILSPGADPIGALTLHAEKMGFIKAFETVSMGKGQGPIAEKLIRNAQKAGTWVCLQNCHLATSWLPTLEQIWEDMDVHNTALTFRLWLTSYPVENFPPTLLQYGVKMTNEPPTGLKQNLLRSYNSEPMNNEQFYTGCPDKYKAFTKLLYGLCFFHAVVQERRKFGPMGWNIPYGFNETDFQISVKQLQMFINEFAEIPFETVAYLTAECNYGGRVTDEWDRRVIGTLLEDYFNENVVKDVTYKFSDTSAAFAIPTKFEHRDIVKHIEKNIPNDPSTEVYGLHMNAGIFKDLTMSKILLKCLTMTLGTADDETPERAQESLVEIVRGIEKRLPELFDLEVLAVKFPTDYHESLNTVLMQELEKFNALLEEIRTTCREIDDAVGGFGVFTPRLEKISKSLKNGEIPRSWQKKSFPSLKPVGSYIEDLLERLTWFGEWATSGTPETFWLPGFFFTQTFLTGILQNHARRCGIPIDELTFDHTILEDAEEESSMMGVKISGLLLEGAKWNAEKKLLDEQEAKILIDPMPRINLQPILRENLKLGTRYKCPTYRTMDRRGELSTAGHSSNFILPILLPTDRKSSHWIKRSVALVCQTND